MKNVQKLCCLIIFSVFLYNEVLVYFQFYSFWPSDPGVSKLKILLVADPQIPELNDPDNVLRQVCGSK